MIYQGFRTRLLVILIAVFSGHLVLCYRAAEAAVTSLDTTDDGVLIHDGTGLLQLQVWGDRVIRVRYTSADRLPDTKSLIVISSPGKEKFEKVEAPAYVGIRTAGVEARVDRASSAVSFIDSTSGKEFLDEAPHGRGTTSTVVDAKKIMGPSLTFVRQPGEAIIGLGQHPQGLFNYTNTRVHLQQKNTDIGIPVLVSSAGYALLWDNASVTDVDTASDQVKWSSESGDSIDYYVLYGPDLNQAISGYRKLTGDAPMFGRWAWGLWQSRERFASQDEILGVAREYRKRSIPIDGMVQDWQYWSPFAWGSHRFGPRFPDPTALMKELHDEHFHAIITVWAKFVQGSRNYDEMEKAGNLYPPVYPNVYPAGQAKWYDPFNPQARAMYWRQINEEIGVHGWDGWWLDATEPELGGAWGEFRGLTTGAGPGCNVFNAYPLMTTTGVYQGQRERKPDVRPFILTRSAFAGQQRNGAVAWSGDVAGNWEVFKNQIPNGLNFVASGIPYWNTDTGGFFGGAVTDPDYRELFTRWFQFSCFCPMLRVHGTGDPKYLWNFGEETGRTLVAYDKLRYRLLPYIYSTSWQVTSAHASMMRPLLMDYREDASVYNIGDQYLFGPGLMVCPVTKPVGDNMVVIPPDSLVDAEGHPGGLSAVYFQGEKFDTEVLRRRDPAIDFDWDHVKREGVGANPRMDPIPGLSMDHFSVRWQGFVRTSNAGKYSFRLRADDGMRMWIDGKLVIEDWAARKAVTKTAMVDLPAHSKVPIKIEYFQNINNALIDLRWQPAAEDQPKLFTRKVYLPAGKWFDFWTGTALEGGRTIDAAAPIERLPLFVKVGTILPMGPEVAYASEQPDAPLEVRIYRGANGSFTLYDDAGDGYGYEHGERATIPLSWDDKTGTLTFGVRAGSYPNMPAHRQFNVVVVTPTHGTGQNISTQGSSVNYDGSAVSITPASGG